MVRFHHGPPDKSKTYITHKVFLNLTARHLREPLYDLQKQNDLSHFSMMAQILQQFGGIGNKLNVVQDDVTKNYPASLHATVLNTRIGGENAMTEALKHRDQLLNSLVPGLSSQQAHQTDPYDGQQEILKLAKEFERNPNAKNRKRYINFAHELAETKLKNK